MTVTDLQKRLDDLRAQSLMIAGAIQFAQVLLAEEQAREPKESE